MAQQPTEQYPLGATVTFKNGTGRLVGHVNGTPIEESAATYVPVWSPAKGTTVYVRDSNIIGVDDGDT